MAREHKRNRSVTRAVVLRTEQLSPELIRVVFTGDGLRSLPELTLTDHYVKLLYPPAGAAYTSPFDPEVLQETLPREQWPVTRTYTIRSYDPETNELAIDFVVHGDEGLAGPWAAAARPGDELGFYGPGGGYAPDPEAPYHLLAGDESALPAIAAALDVLPDDTDADVFVEVAGPEGEIPVRTTERTRLHWIHRGDRPYGVPLADAVRSVQLPEGRRSVFVHGNADMIKVLRRWFYVDQGLERAQASISGYWRTNLTEDVWQASKREFVESMDAEEAAAGATA
nr:siderophore-interacting protein [Pseudoclavibacter chungangensis]